MCVCNFWRTTYVLFFLCVLWYRFESANAIIGDTLPQQAEKGLAPFAVGLIVLPPMRERVKSFFCGGTLITTEYALTAAHCLETHKSGKIGVLAGSVDLETSLVYIVKWWKTFDAWANEKKRKCRFWDTSPRRYPNNDIAIIKLTDAVHESLIGVLSRKPRSSFIEKEVLAVGWGRTNGRGSSTYLRKAWFKVMKKKDISRFDPLTAIDASENLIWLHNDPPVAVQNRDRGCPVMAENDDGTFEIIAILSGDYSKWLELSALNINDRAILVKPYEKFIKDMLSQD